MVFLWFSYGFPMVFLWFSNGGLPTLEHRLRQPPDPVAPSSRTQPRSGITSKTWGCLSPHTRQTRYLMHNIIYIYMCVCVYMIIACIIHVSICIYIYTYCIYIYIDIHKLFIYIYIFNIFIYSRYKDYDILCTE